MKYASMFIALSAVLAGPALAGSLPMPDSAKPCLGCHQVDKKVVGPAFKDIAKQYKGDPGAEARLADATVNGSKGVWGAYTMLKQNVSPEDAKAIAHWIMSL